MSEENNYNIDRESEQIHKSFAGEKAKLSQMSFGEKVEYIFAYYKVHIIIILAIITIIAYVIHHALTYVAYQFYGVVVNTEVVDTSRQDDIRDYLEMDKHTGVSLLGGLSGDIERDATNYYNQLNIYTISGQVDFAFVDEAGAKYMCSLGALSSVEDSVPVDLQDLWADRVVEMDVYDCSTEDEYVSAPVAFDITGTQVQEYFGLEDDTCYLMICNLSGHPDYMEKFGQMLYDIETGSIPVK